MIQRTIFILSFLLLVCGTQYKLDEIRKDTRISVEDELKYLPSGKFLKGAALNYDKVLADLLWIKALGYFGDQLVTSKDFTWLYHILDITTILDPYFEDPYEFGGIILSNEVGDVEKGSQLLKKGMENIPQSHPRYWYLPFFLAYNYWYYQNDYKSGAKYLEIASRHPQAPSYLPLLVARMYANVSQPQVALVFLDEMIKTAKNPDRKAELLNRRKEVLVNFHLDVMENAINIFYSKYKRYPYSLLELISVKIIDHIPEEPFGGEYVYDPVTHRVHSTKRDRLKLNPRKI